MIDNKDKQAEVSKDRTVTSDLIIDMSKKYFKELNLPAELRREIDREVVAMPYGSVLRGNASEKSDLDLICVTKKPRQLAGKVISLVDGTFDKSGVSLDDTLQREVDVPAVSMDDLLNSIRENNVVEEANGGGGHSYANILGLILNVDPKMVIAGSISLLEETKGRIQKELDKNPAILRQVQEEYDYFMNWRKPDGY